MKNGFKDIAFYILLILMILFTFSLFTNTSNVKEWSYSRLIQELENGNVGSITLQEMKASVKLKGDKKEVEYSVYVPDVSSLIREISDDMKEGKVDFLYKLPPQLPWWVSMIIPVALLIVTLAIFWVFFFQQAQGGGNRVMSFGKSKAKMISDDKKKVTFGDVAGADEEKEELEEIVEFLKMPKKFIDLGARIPKGVLLVGPPGTGKTLLAKAVSGEAGVPFFSISGSDFVEMFVGVGASRVRDLFEQAKRNAPSIIFIDEIDAVGRHRGAGLGGGHDEREQTLNQLLVEMDGFGVNEGVIILAATNRPDILDPALLRPGRFDRRVVVGLPDIKGREAVLRVHARNKPLGEDVDLADLAKITPGFTGADLENLLNEAALLSARQSKTEIGMGEIKEATFKVMLGPEKKSKVMTEQEKRLTAYHEAGHAIAVRAVSTTNKVERISIIPTGMAGGYTTYKPDEDRSYITKSHLVQEIVVALGGRAAEELMLKEVSTGAANDLSNANRTARNMIMKYGMSHSLPNMVFGGEAGEVFIGRDLAQTKDYSEEVAAAIDKEVKALLKKAYDDTLQILKANQKVLEVLADRLMEKEKIEAVEFETIFLENDGNVFRYTV
ncbi:MAG: ATP-dependent zinc metalloprotease FtsH [Clostridiales bacterium]|nr:ATP-dependent zinc metalloprotease FtsH [Clostridiales bacterium]